MTLTTKMSITLKINNEINSNYNGNIKFAWECGNNKLNSKLLTRSDMP